MTATLFLIQSVFGFYTLAIVLRFLLQCVRADFYHPLVQFLVKITNFPLLRIRQIIPSYRGYDLASVILAFFIQFVEIFLITILVGKNINFLNLILISLAELIKIIINIYLWSVVIETLLIWISPDPFHPSSQLLSQLTTPLLQPIRHLITPISGIDLSPILVIILLIFTSLLLQDLLGLWIGIG